MASKKVEDFFKNKVCIRLKNGHQFKGLLSSIDNQNGVIVLEDIEDLGNTYDKQLLPSDKKILEKKFASSIIDEIVLTDKVFADPKKYNKDDFFDSMTEQKEPQYHEDRGQRQYRPRGRGGRGRGGRDSEEYRGRGDYEKPHYENDYQDKNEKPKRNYEAKERRQEEDDRQYR